MRRSVIAILVCLAALPASAEAGTFTRSQNVVSYKELSGSNLWVYSDGGKLRVDRGMGGSTIFAGSGCVQVIAGDSVTCGGAAGLTAAVFELANQADHVEADPALTTRLVVDGSGSNDILVGGAGYDSLDGGSEDDTLAGGGGGDLLKGGPGRDTVDYSERTTRVVVSANGVPGDGGESEGDNVQTDVEVVLGGAAGDELYAASGPRELHGGGGPDKIAGGPAVDVLDGGPGADLVAARDGKAEVVDCGLGGGDVGIGDVVDVFENCETVQLPDDDKDGSQLPGDCDDANAAVKPGAADVPGNGVDEDCSGADATAPAVAPAGGGAGGGEAPGSSGPGHGSDTVGALDRDGDLVLAPHDCDDGAADVAPGAQDAPANGRDEDCDGRDAALPALGAKVTARWKARRLRSLRVRGLPAGARAELVCTGPGCPFTTRVLAVRGGRAAAPKALARRALRAGTLVEVRLAAPGRSAQRTRFTVRRGRAPLRADA